MPLLMCPNDNSAMQEIDRNGVKIDVCPQCRGVWLDRGELEKLMSLMSEESPGPSAGSSLPHREGATYRREEPRYDRDHDRGYDRDDDYRRRKKKKRFELFDFFD